MDIVTRSEWGAQPWSTEPYSVPLDERTEFFVHYDGATPITRTGNAIPRAIDAEHHGNGWSGIGYNFVVSQAGEIFEGRGWDLQGAHCPSHNRSGFGVQVAVGGTQEPTAEALHAARWLYEEACRKTGRTLAKKGHKDGFATDCPGTRLYPWVLAGMPDPGGASEPTKPSEPAPAPSQGRPFPGRYLQLSVPLMRGQDVYDWQKRMRERGWNIDVDALDKSPHVGYGQQCKRICIAFQREKGLSQDGVVGPKTWAAAFRTDNVTR